MIRFRKSSLFKIFKRVLTANIIILFRYTTREKQSNFLFVKKIIYKPINSIVVHEIRTFEFVLIPMWRVYIQSAPQRYIITFMRDVKLILFESESIILLLEKIVYFNQFLIKINYQISSCRRIKKNVN